MMHFMLKAIFKKIWQTQIPKQKDNLNLITWHFMFSLSNMHGA